MLQFAPICLSNDRTGKHLTVVDFKPLNLLVFLCTEYVYFLGVDSMAGIHGNTVLSAVSW